MTVTYKPTNVVISPFIRYSGTSAYSIYICVSCEVEKNNFTSRVFAKAEYTNSTKKIRSLFVKSEVEVEVDLRKRNGLNIWPVEKKHEWE